MRCPPTPHKTIQILDHAPPLPLQAICNLWAPCDMHVATIRPNLPLTCSHACMHACYAARSGPAHPPLSSRSCGASPRSFDITSKPSHHPTSCHMPETPHLHFLQKSLEGHVEHHLTHPEPYWFCPVTFFRLKMPKISISDCDPSPDLKQSFILPCASWAAMLEATVA